MSKRSPGFERCERDFYPTPAKAVLPLVPHLRAARLRRFAEPCCGDGSLVRHLESVGLTCAYAGDIPTGQDTLAIQGFDAPVITNPPYERKLMHALIWHFIATAPCTWLLLEYDWTATRQARPFLPHCSDIVMVGRLRWIEGSPFTGKDTSPGCALRPITTPARFFTPGENPTLNRTTACAWCSRSFVRARSDAKFCSHACRQKAFRERIVVT